MSRFLALTLYLGMFALIGCSKRDQHEYTDIYADYVCEYFDTYEEQYNAIVDTFLSWEKDSLNFSISYRFDSWQIDSTIIYDHDSTRLFTVRLDVLDNRRDSKMAIMQPVGGSLINGRWYYYDMGWMPWVYRSKYKRGVYEPLSFDELSYIAHKKVFKNILIKDSDEKYISNMAFFKKYFFSTHIPGEYETRAEADSFTLENQSRRGKLSKEKLDEIQAEIDATVRPPEPDVDYPKVMFFESEAWLNRPRCEKEKN